MLKTQYFRGATSRNIELATNNGTFYIPEPLFNNVIDWYHTYLIRLGVTRTEETIQQHLYWTILQREVNFSITKCETCILSNKRDIQFCQIPEKVA